MRPIQPHRSSRVMTPTARESSRSLRSSASRSWKQDAKPLLEAETRALEVFARPGRAGAHGSLGLARGLEPF